MAQSSAVDALRIFPLQQFFPRPQLRESIEASIASEMRFLFGEQRYDGKRIAVTANSRGIVQQARILNAIVSELRKRGAEVLIIPAIGSHGQGTEEGDLAALARVGVTPETVDAPFLAGGETVHIASVQSVPVHCVETALKVDGVLLFGRTKEHTDIYWPAGSGLAPWLRYVPRLAGVLGMRWGLESGPHKTLAIGLAKMRAADLHASSLGLGVAIEIAARRLLQEPRLNVLGAISVIENAYDETARIDAVSTKQPDRFFEKLRRLLDYSKTLMPHLPWPEGYYDGLYIYRAGKRIAGQGVHTKTLGVAPNHVTRGVAWGPGMPSIHTIVCSTLDGTNAMGRGKFQFVNRRYAEQMDEELTRTNAQTAGYPEAIRMPEVCENDRDLLNAALQVCTIGTQGVRFAFAVSTMWLENVWLTEAFLEEAAKLDPRRARIAGALRPVPFDEHGNIRLPSLQGV